MSKHEISFKPIPQAGGGKVCLTIYPPGKTIFGRDGYAVFVGGCGVGHQRTLTQAKAYLLEQAKVYCRRQINDGHEKTIWYSRMLERLHMYGLEKEKRNG